MEEHGKVVEDAVGRWSRTFKQIIRVLEMQNFRGRYRG